MITEDQQEQVALCALGALTPEERERFIAEVRANSELRQLLWSLQTIVDKVALTLPRPNLPPDLKGRILGKLRANQTNAAANATRAAATNLSGLGLTFQLGPASSGWKELPIKGAWIKLLSAQPDRGYAVLLGKLDPGVRYPAHINVGPEDFYILTGDLQVGDKALGPGDFHHADAGSAHQENFSVEGCTLLAVMTMDDPLVRFAMG